MKEAGGCAAGFTGRLFNFNSDAEQRLADALMTVGKFVQGESGCLLGHIKAAVYVDDGEGITLNLIDMDNGVEHHGTMNRADEVKFNFMCAVLDVDEHELTHEMLHAIDDSGLDYAIDRESLEHHHHHHHDGEECDDPDCDCHKHHDHDECDDPDCDCHKHHHVHEDGEECDDPDCECHKHHHHSLADLIDENGRLRADHHHDHEHHHDHDEDCGCGHHHHDDEECDDPDCDCHKHHHEHEHGEECHCHDHDEKAEPEKKEKKGFFGFLRRKK